MFCFHPDSQGLHKECCTYVHLLRYKLQSFCWLCSLTDLNTSHLLVQTIWMALLQVSTEAVVLVNKGMWHIEGGWPKDLDCTEQEQTARFIRKVGSAPPAQLHAACLLAQHSASCRHGVWAAVNCAGDACCGDIEGRADWQRAYRLYMPSIVQRQI